MNFSNDNDKWWEATQKRQRRVTGRSRQRDRTFHELRALGLPQNASLGLDSLLVVAHR